MKNKHLREQVNKILLEDWNPIGIENPYEDEYSGYISSIIKLLESNADEYKMTKLLHEHARVNMGMSTTFEEHSEVAKKLLELK